MNMKHSLRAVIATLTLAVAIPAGAQTCRSDLNGDGQVNGADLGIMLADWGFCPATITSVTPLQGGTQGGTVISISGTGLSTASSVRVGGVACTNLNVLTPTLVQATTPAGAVGQASISVTTAAGTTLASTPFSYVQQQVTSIVPNTGPYAGGTPITITGQYLAGTTAVTIGGVPCTNVVSVSATQVTAVTPAGSVGAVDVVVNGPKGAVTATGGFTYFNCMVPSWATLIEALPDPAVVTDPSLLAAISATGLAWRVRDAGTGIEMLLVPPGTFHMGCNMGSTGFPCRPYELSVHEVTLTNPFYLGRYEVTQAQWVAKMETNPSRFKEAPDSPYRPVESVGVKGTDTENVLQYLTRTGFRLPTEAEWEFACRAGTSFPYYNGSTDDVLINDLAWTSGNSVGQTHAVGGKLPNGFGFYDMLGNVGEFVADYWGDSYTANAQINPVGPSSHPIQWRVLRGGDWAASAAYSRSSSRVPGDIPYQDRGFRVAHSP